jgi:queuosine precursor transporter
MTNRRLAAGISLLAVYIGSIVASNWLTTRYGLITIAPGLFATAGTVTVGGAIMTRDLLQDALGRLLVLAAITTGAAISYLLSSHQIAVASGVTFLVAESLEFAVYTPLRKRYGWGTGRWSGVVAVANATGAIGDTFLFLWLAGFPLTAAVVAGQLTGKAYVTVAVVAIGVILRRAVLRNPVDPAGA